MFLPSVAGCVDEDESVGDAGVELAKEVDAALDVAKVDDGGEDRVELVVLEPADGQDLAALNRSRVADLKRAAFLSLSFRNGFFTATTLNVGSSFLTLAIPM